MVCSLPGSSLCGISQARTLGWVAISVSKGPSDPGIEPESLELQADSLPLGKLANGKQSTHQCRRGKRHGFNMQVEKILWRGKWQPTPVFLPGKSHRWRSLPGCSPWGRKESDTTERLTHVRTTGLHSRMNHLWFRDLLSDVSIDKHTLVEEPFLCQIPM